MNEVPWSLHLLSELLAAFTVEDPQALRSVIHRVAESVDAEVVAIVNAEEVKLCIGLSPDQQAPLPSLVAEQPATMPLGSGCLHVHWTPLGRQDQLLVARMGHAFDLEERSLLRAMGRSIELSSEVLRAVRAERQAKEEALLQATHDAMTGLPGRGLVLERLQELLQGQGCEPGTIATVLFVDIDRFKQINDVHGHASGDQFLCSVADVLRGVVRGTDLVGRLSGDEFVVITCTRRREDAEGLARRIIEQVSRPLLLAGKLVSHSPSIGIAFAEDDPDTPAAETDGGAIPVLKEEATEWQNRDPVVQSAELLIENADMAMYRAKDLGRGRFACYHHRMRLQAQRRAATEMELRRAVRQGELLPHFQPIVRMPERRIIGFEALARWQHPTRGLLSPIEFVEVAEDSGLIVEIDLLIMHAASRILAGWKRRFPRLPLRLSVNVSGRTFADPALAAHVAEALEAAGLSADELYLEITETMLVDDIEATTSVVEQLKQLGIRLAIDDFGTGYSSLLYLKRFPVGILKIDRSFIDGLGVDREDEVIVRAVIGVARSLGIDLVAEGVETERQLQILAELGCNDVQGYGLGRPMDAAAAELLLEQAALALDRG